MKKMVYKVYGKYVDGVEKGADELSEYCGNSFKMGGAIEDSAAEAKTKYHVQE